MCVCEWERDILYPVLKHYALCLNLSFVMHMQICSLIDINTHSKGIATHRPLDLFLLPRQTHTHTHTHMHTHAQTHAHRIPDKSLPHFRVDVMFQCSRDIWHIKNEWRKVECLGWNTVLYLAVLPLWRTRRIFHFSVYLSRSRLVSYISIVCLFSGVTICPGIMISINTASSLSACSHNTGWPL